MGIKPSKKFRKLSGIQDARIIMVGLDGAGKTTMLYQLKLGEVVATAPTIGFNVETVEFRSMNFNVWDVGSQNNKIRPLWRHYFDGAEGLIFVVDSTDRERIDIARVELESMLKEKHMQHVALLVFANKQDLPNAMPADEVASKLRLWGLKHINWTVQPACAINGLGTLEGLDWLESVLQPV